MFRDAVRRILPVFLLASALPMAAPASTAAAATTDVLTFESSTGSTAQTYSTTSAVFTAYDGTSGLGASGANTRFASGLNVTLAPPVGKQFTSGTSYPAAISASGSDARLDPHDGLFTDGCPGSLNATFAGTVLVRAATYDAGGRLSELAADFTASCRLQNGGVQRVAGSVRHASTLPWLALRAAYTNDIVPQGLSRTQDVTISGTGSGVTGVVLGDATLSGRRADDYTVVDNGCAGIALGEGDSCRVAVRFEPRPPAPNESNSRQATLTVAAAGHVSDGVRVVLESRAITLPPAPSLLSTFPTTAGVGVSWRASDAGQYTLDRRRDGETDWTRLATVDSVGGDGMAVHIDRDTARGSTATYRVTPSNAGWQGEAATVVATRASTDPVPTARQLVSARVLSDNPDHRASLTVGSDDPNAVFSISGGELDASLTPPPGSGESRHIILAVPALPGPGLYRDGDLAGGMRSLRGESCSSFSSRTLVVRSVLYSETGAVLLLDASWVGVCRDGWVAQVELRLGTDAADTPWSAAPVSLGRLISHHGSVVTTAAAISNAGTEDQSLGEATIHGAAAADWRVLTNDCTGRTLAPGDQCGVEVSFTSGADGARAAVLEVARSDAAGQLAPASLALDGWGATPPGAPIANATGTVGAILLSWRLADNGGLPVQRYEVERRVEGADWLPVGTAPDGPHPSWVDRDPPADGAIGYYRVRGVNAAGAGPWQAVGLGATTRSRAVLVSARPGDLGLRGVYQLTIDDVVDTPVVALTDDPAHDYRTPAAAPGGTRLAVSVSTTDGSDGEYDLWTGPLSTPASTRLTSMSGAERNPAWSPDAATIAFTSVATDGHRSVWTVPAGGGEPRLLRDHAAHPAFTPDGLSLVVEDDSTPDAPLLLVNAVSGVTTSTLAGSARGSQPSVAPSGTIAWIDEASGDVLTLAPGDGTPTTKASQADRTFGNPAFTDTGQLLFDETLTATGENPDRYTVLLKAVVEPDAVLRDMQAPFAVIDGVHDQEVVPGGFRFTLRLTDDLTPRSALMAQCRVDQEEWIDCRNGGSVAGLTDGTHRISVRVTDLAGNTSQNWVSFSSDTVAPTIVLTGPSSTELAAGAATFRWVGADEGFAELTYDVTVSTSTAATSPPPAAHPAGWGDAEARTSLVTRLTPGQETCVSVRARDGGGNWSAPARVCAARALDDTSLKAGSGWKHRRVAGTFLSTESVASRKSVTLRTTTVTVRRIGVMVTTCKGCGSLGVYLGSRYLGAVSLASTRTVRQQVRFLPLLSSATTGVLKLKTRSSRTVRVDGVVLARN